MPTTTWELAEDAAAPAYKWNDAKAWDDTLFWMDDDGWTNVADAGGE